MLGHSELVAKKNLYLNSPDHSLIFSLSLIQFPIPNEVDWNENSIAGGKTKTSQFHIKG